MDATPRVLRGPLAWVGWAVAAAWLGLGVVAWLRFGEPAGWVIAGVSALAAAATGVVSNGLRVLVSEAGVTLAGGHEVAWEDVDHVGVRSGLVSVPYLAVRVGRALDDVPLDGIAAFGRSGALRLAEQVADAGSLGEVRMAGGQRPTGRGRRGIPG